MINPPPYRNRMNIPAEIWNNLSGRGIIPRFSRKPSWSAPQKMTSSPRQFYFCYIPFQIFSTGEKIRVIHNRPTGCMYENEGALFQSLQSKVYKIYFLQFSQAVNATFLKLSGRCALGKTFTEN